MLVHLFAVGAVMVRLTTRVYAPIIASKETWVLQLQLLVRVVVIDGLLRQYFLILRATLNPIYAAAATAGGRVLRVVWRGSREWSVAF